MKRIFGIAWLLTALVLVGSCKSSPTPRSMEWPFGAEFPYKESAITLRLTADSRLNMFNAKPSSLHICMYQLRDPNKFNENAGNENTLGNLLNQNCSFPESSVVGAVPITVQPGETVKYIYNRAEGARYIAFVAGYYASRHQDRVVRLERVPVIFVEKKTGAFSSEEVAVPADMDIQMTLGQERIQEIKVNP